MGEQNVWRRIKGKVAVDRENEEVICGCTLKQALVLLWKANQDTCRCKRWSQSLRAKNA